MNIYEDMIRQTLADMRYQSSRGYGERGLMQHHVDAITKAVIPIVNDLKERLDKAADKGIKKQHKILELKEHNDRLFKALAFAQSVILSGESMTEQAQQIIGGALKAYKEKSPCTTSQD